MSGIQTKAALDALRVGWMGAFLQSLEATPAFYPKIARIVPTSNRTVVTGGFAMQGQLRKWTGDRQFQGGKEDAYTLSHDPFEYSWEVKRIDIEDDTLEMYSGMFAEAGEIATQGKDTMFFDMINDATTTVGYDGVPFFSATHPVTIGSTTTTQSNYLPGAGPAWYLLDQRSAVSRPFLFIMRKEVQVVRRDREQDDPVFLQGNYQYGLDGRFGAGLAVYQRAFCSKELLTPDSLGKAITAMKRLTRNNGIKTMISPTILMVPTSLLEKARAAIKSQFAFTDGKISSENMWVNAVPEILDVPYLTE